MRKWEDEGRLRRGNWCVAIASVAWRSLELRDLLIIAELNLEIRCSSDGVSWVVAMAARCSLYCLVVDVWLIVRIVSSERVGHVIWYCLL